MSLIHREFQFECFDVFFTGIGVLLEYMCFEDSFSYFYFICLPVYILFSGCIEHSNFIDCVSLANKIDGSLCFLKLNTSKYTEKVGL